MQITKRDFPEGYDAFWKMLYADDSLRVFMTNQGNHFAMVNEAAEGTPYEGWGRFDKSKFK